MEHQTPVEQIIALFNIEQIVEFFISAGVVLLAFWLGKKALSMANGFLISRGLLDHPNDPYYGSDIAIEDRVYDSYNYDRSTNTYYKPKKKKKYYKNNYRKKRYNKNSYGGKGKYYRNY